MTDKIICKGESPLNSNKILKKIYNEENNVYMCLRKDGKWWINNILPSSDKSFAIWQSMSNFLSVDQCKKYIAQCSGKTFEFKRLNRLILNHLSKFEELKPFKFKNRPFDIKHSCRGANKNVYVWLMKNDLIKFEPIVPMSKEQKRKKQASHTAKWKAKKQEEYCLKKYGVPYKFYNTDLRYTCAKGCVIYRRSNKQTWVLVFQQNKKRKRFNTGCIDKKKASKLALKYFNKQKGGA
jgi:hypothetical protein